MCWCVKVGGVAREGQKKAQRGSWANSPIFYLVPYVAGLTAMMCISWCITCVSLLINMITFLNY